MSYCRFSDDNWMSDVYVYGAFGGYTIHVASNRRIGTRPTVPRIGDAPREEWLAAHRKQMEWLDNNQPTPIGLPFDGQDFGLATAKECADKLLSLRDAGYHVPQRAIDRLMEDAAEDSDV